VIERLNRYSPKGLQTRRRILEAARRVLADEGLERFTTRRVAQAAHVSHGMCHYYFADKNDLVRALIELARADWVQPLEKLVSSGESAERRMRAVIGWLGEPATIEVMRVHSALFWFALRNEDIRESLAAEYRDWRRQFVRLFEKLAEETKFAGLSAPGIGEAFASAADGLVQQQVLDRDLPTERMLNDLLDQLLGR
jgi:AcrR family transcriptional regulator